MRVGHLYRIPELLQAIGENPAFHLWTNRPTDEWDGIRLSSMLEAIQTAGFVSRSAGGMLLLTASGRLVVAEQTPQAKFRRAVMQLYSYTKPPWISLTPLGRQAIRASVSPEDLQCLEESGLLDESDRDTVAWWDSLACTVRTQRDQDHLEIGRDAEGLTLGYESWRTGTMPHWIAIESTLAGYDVLSRISSSDASTLMIEVKGSTRSPGTASITLSRNEWNTLVDSSRAVLDAWLIDGGHYATLHRVTMEPLSTLIPVDQRCGKWQTVVIPYASLPPACAQATWTESADHSCDYRDISE